MSEWRYGYITYQPGPLLDHNRERSFFCFCGAPFTANAPNALFCPRCRQLPAKERKALQKAGRVGGGPTAAQALRLKKVAERRGLPFIRIGMRIEVDGHPGVVAGGNDSDNFDVFFVGGPHCGQTGNCHPWWMTRYFDRGGKVLAEFRDGRNPCGMEAAKHDA